MPLEGDNAKRSFDHDETRRDMRGRGIPEVQIEVVIDLEKRVQQMRDCGVDTAAVVLLLEPLSHGGVTAVHIFVVGTTQQNAKQACSTAALAIGNMEKTLAAGEAVN